MNAEEEYSESNTIFCAFRKLVSGSATETIRSDASAIFGVRGERYIMDVPLLSSTNTTPRSPETAWD